MTFGEQYSLNFINMAQIFERPHLKLGMSNSHIVHSIEPLLMNLAINAEIS